MAGSVHIPLEELTPDMKALLYRADANDVFVDGAGVTYRISRLPGRTLAEILSDPSIVWSNVTLDEDWNQDIQEIIALRKQETHDPWAE